MPAINKNPTIDLTSHTSWLLEGGKDLFPEPIPDYVSELLREITDNHLAIITDEIHNEKIQIGKPSGWNDSVTSFHVFFKNKYNIWNYFRAENITPYQSFILFSPPTKVFFLQRRRCKRIAAPTGTKVIFREMGHEIDSAYVQDVSAGGMLIGINSAKTKYPSGSIIHEMLITIPPKTKSGKKNIIRKIIPVILNGKVVRTFYDRERLISCYGISFLFKNDSSKIDVNNLISYIEKTRKYPHLFHNEI